MMDRQSGYIEKLGRRVEFILRELKALADRLKWAEQRIKELAFPPSINFAAAIGANYFDTAVVAKVTQSPSIGARSGTTYGSGTVKLQTDGGTSLSDYSPTTTFVAKNLLNKTILQNALVICVRVGNSWWIIAAGDCADVV